MASENVPIGSPRAVHLYSAALFARLARIASMRKLLTGPAPKQGGAARQLRHETSSGYPIVEIRDLSKQAGDSVGVDIVDIMNGKPVMGDRRLSGRMMRMNFATQDIRINQIRGGADPGGRMTQQRTVHDLRMLALANLSGWNNTLLDNMTQVHLAGARGDQTGRDWNVPLESDPDFGEIMVNPVLPPTYNRRFIPGAGHGTTSDLDSTDVMSLEVIEDVRTMIDEAEYPLQGIRLQGDPAADDDDPLYVLYVSPRQYQSIRDGTSDRDWNTLVSNAVTRAAMTKHPLFGNGSLMWRGILIKKTRRVIRFNDGSVVREYDANGDLGSDTISLGGSGGAVDRALLLGAQALGVAYGQHSKSRFHINWHEEESDHGNRVEVSTSLMAGYRKLTFELDGVSTDHGVFAIDTAVPNSLG